jgi:hypothetical protein
MMTESISLTALSWLATYLVHSTLLIGCVWAFTGACSLDSLTRSLLWKLALVGGLFTATLQTGLGVQPALGLLSLGEQEPEVININVDVPRPERLSDASRVLLISGSDVIRIDERGVCIGPGCEIPDWRSAGLIVHDDGVCIGPGCVAPGLRSPGLMLAGMTDDHGFAPPGFLLTVDEAHEVPMAAAPVVTPEGPDGEQIAGWLVGLFLVGAGASLLRFGFMVRGLRRSLRGRTLIKVGPLHERLAALVARARVRRLPLRLTVSAGLRSPVALASGEIVVPPEALELEARQQEAMLAHELAHVLRRDPAWLVLAAVIEALLFIQPLNRVARRGMQEAAEELSDDWAVRHIGSGLHLARCLTEVAGWIEREDNSGTTGRLASPMASGSGSLLVRRVRRLLAQQPGARRLAGAWRVMLGLGLLLAVGLGAPGFAPPVAQAGAPVVSEAEVAEGPHGMPFMTALGDPDDEEMPVLAALPAALSSESEGSRGAGAAPVSGRERRLARRAARLERRADKLRERSGTDASPRIVVSPAGAGPGADARRGIPSEAELRRIVAEAQKSIPSEEELRRIVAAAQKSVPSEEELRRIVAEAQKSIPSEEELRRIVAAAQEDIPSEEEVRRLEAEARKIEAEVRRRVMPREADIRRIEAQARRIAERAVKLDAREMEALEREAEALGREAEALGRELERAAGQIERELRRGFEEAPMPPMPPMPPGAGPRGAAPPMPPMPPMPPVVPGSRGAAPPMPPAVPGSRGAAPPMPPAPPAAPSGAGMAPRPPAPPAVPAPRGPERRSAKRSGVTPV